MNTKWLVWVCVIAAGCGRPAERRAPDARTATVAEEAHVEEPNTVEIDEGMRRDLRITTRMVESRAGGERVVLLGELAVDQGTYAEVGTPVAARVTRVMASAGDVVRRDQPLVELTSPELGRERAAYEAATTRLALAEALLQRKRSLAAERIVPLREVQEAELAVNEARAAMALSRAAIAAFTGSATATGAEDGTSPTFLLAAPVGGSVIERAVVVGQMLDPATPAFRIGDLSTLWLTVHAFERDAVRIPRGVTARLTFPALPGQSFSGVVAVVGRQVDSSSRTVPVRIDLRNASGVLRPGMSATAAVPVGMSGDPILTVPVTSVQRVRGEWCVFLPKDVHHFEIRRIGRGRDLGDEVEVLSGLRGDEQIVVDGAFLLKARAEQGEADHHGH